MTIDNWIPFLAEIADEADAIALRYFRRPDLRVDTKSNQTPVSEADLAIESAARRIAAARHPELGMLGEEEGATGSTSARIILDPIDATRNFVRGIPVFATLIAIELEGEIVAGLVSAPALATRWHAARGAGAWSGNRRLAVSTIGSWSDAQVFHGSLGGSEKSQWSSRIATVSARAHRDRGFGDFWQHVLIAEGSGRGRARSRCVGVGCGAATGDCRGSRRLRDNRRRGADDLRRKPCEQQSRHAPGRPECIDKSTIDNCFRARRPSSPCSACRARR